MAFPVASQRHLWQAIKRGNKTTLHKTIAKLNDDRSLSRKSHFRCRNHRQRRESRNLSFCASRQLAGADCQSQHYRQVSWGLRAQPEFFSRGTVLRIPSSASVEEPRLFSAKGQGPILQVQMKHSILPPSRPKLLIPGSRSVQSAPKGTKHDWSPA